MKRLPMVAAQNPWTAKPHHSVAFSVLSDCSSDKAARYLPIIPSHGDVLKHAWLTLFPIIPSHPWLVHRVFRGVGTCGLEWESPYVRIEHRIIDSRPADRAEKLHAQEKQ
jgi:hypothetical protein